MNLPSRGDVETCLSAPHDMNKLPKHPPSLKLNRPSLNISVREISSMNDISVGTSGILFARNIYIKPDSDLNDSSVSTRTGNTSSSAARTFNWRIFLSPWSITLGAAIVVYSCGMGVTYQTLPSLGSTSG